MKKAIVLILFLAFLGTETAYAQTVKKSQKGTISQTIATTNIQIEYFRPVARDRMLFGEDGIISYDAIWMPGANDATTIEISEDISVNGSVLKKG